jgi:hypothetical protein
MGATMPRTVIQIYAAAVCFVSVGCLAVALGIATYSAIGVVNPSLTANPMLLVPPPSSPPLPFPVAPPDSARVTGVTGTAGSQPLSAEDEAIRKAAALEFNLRTESTLSRQSVIRQGIVALISALLFVVHWRILRRGA